MKSQYCLQTSVYINEVNIQLEYKLDLEKKIDLVIFKLIKVLK